MIYESSIKLSIDSKIVHVALLAKAVRGICSSVIYDEQTLYNLELCIVEAVTNVINHAYKRNPNKTVEVFVKVNDQAVTFKIVDQGEKHVNPIIKKELDYNPKDVNALPESGMGLFLIHKLMDEVSYTEQDDKNVLFMKKIHTAAIKKSR